MSNSFYNKDWVKQAATAANDMDVEKVFNDQASGYVENKLGPLMGDDYRIGFEIVKKNDDNTRMVGVFAFKVDKEIIFAPVFFINGEIKGPLLYCCNTRNFIPANKEWSTYLVEAMESDEGRGVNKSRRKDSAPFVQMERLSMKPPTMSKSSGLTVGTNKCLDVPCIVKNLPTQTGVEGKEVTIPNAKDGQPMLSDGSTVFKVKQKEDCTVELECLGDSCTLSKKAAEDIFNAADFGIPVVMEVGPYKLELTSEAAEQVKQACTAVDADENNWDVVLANVDSGSGAIREFIHENGEYGVAAYDAIIKAATAEAGYDFAYALASIYPDPSVLIPDKSSLEKSASAEPVEEEPLELLYEPELVKSASGCMNKDFFEDGFLLKDRRNVDELSVAWVNNDASLQSPTTFPGVYDVLDNSGEFIENVTIAQIAGLSETASNEDNYVSEIYGSMDHTPDIVLVKDGKMVIVKTALTIFKSQDVPEGQSTVSAGKAYLIKAGASDTLIGPVYVKSTSKAGNVVEVKLNPICPRVNRKLYTDTYNQTVLYINPDKKTDLSKSIAGKDCTFYPIQTEGPDERGKVIKKLDNVAKDSNMSDFLLTTFSNNSAKMLFKSAGYVLETETKKTSPMNKCEMLVKLARDLELSADTAYEILDTAKQNGECNLLFNLTKSASAFYLMDRPTFDEDFDSEFSVPIQPSQSYKLRVQSHLNPQQPAARGDTVKPLVLTGLPANVITSTSPEDLRSLADIYHAPNVFEHGVVGTLADTFNALPIVDKYIPKLQEGVDALGRIKFLLHWCPGDFERAYGSEEQINLEAEVNSNFEAQGSLLLKLLKKSEKLQQGENQHLKKD